MTDDTAPHASDVQPPVDNRPPGDQSAKHRVREIQRRQSRFGIASCIIAIVVVVLMLITAVVTRGAEMSAAYTAVVLFFMFALGLGMGLGIAGLQTPQRRALAFLGVALNGLIWLTIVFLAVLTAATTTVGP